MSASFRNYAIVFVSRHFLTIAIELRYEFCNLYCRSGLKIGAPWCAWDRTSLISYTRWRWYVNKNCLFLCCATYQHCNYCCIYIYIQDVLYIFLCCLSTLSRIFHFCGDIIINGERVNQPSVLMLQLSSDEAFACCV